MSGIYRYIVLLAVLALGCTCPNNIDQNQVILGDEAYILFINAIPGESPLTVEASDKAVLNSLSFDEADLTYHDIDYWERSLSLKNQDGNIVYKGVLSLELAKHYTIIAYNNNSKIGLVLYNDSDIGSYNPDSAYVRIIHLSPDAPKLKIDINNPDTTISNILNKYTSFDGGMRDIPFFPVSPGYYNINILTAMPLPESVLSEIKDYEFAKGRIYTLVIKGLYKEGGKFGLRGQIVGADYFDPNKDKL